MFEFDKDLTSVENARRLIRLYQTVKGKFVKVLWGGFPIVVNPQVAKEFGLIEGQPIDSFCMFAIMNYMQEALMLQQFDKVKPSDFDTDDNEG